MLKFIAKIHKDTGKISIARDFHRSFLRIIPEKSFGKLGCDIRKTVRWYPDSPRYKVLFIYPEDVEFKLC